MVLTLTAENLISSSSSELFQVSRERFSSFFQKSTLFSSMQSSPLLNFPSVLLPSSFPGISSNTFQIVRFQSNTLYKVVGKPLLAVAAADSVGPGGRSDQPSIVLDSLRVLEWDELCDCVASFAGTSLGRKATKEQLWILDRVYEDSVRLLEETNAVVEMHRYGARMDFSGIDVTLVGGSPVIGIEANALIGLLKFAEALQFNVKAAVKEDSDWFRKFMPLSELIMELIISQALIKFVEQLVDEDGSIKDSASSDLRQARNQVRLLERKLFQLMESVIRNETEEATLEVCNMGGRWCIKSHTYAPSKFDGLLLGSGSDGESVIEPLSAVPLNDELQRARTSVAKAEEAVHLRITNKMQMDLNDIENVFRIMIQIDVVCKLQKMLPSECLYPEINARARYSLSFKGACPALFSLQDEDNTITAETSTEDMLNRKKWTMYLPQACHPLLLQQHRHNLQIAEKNLSNAKAEIRRRKQLGGSAKWKEEKNLNLSALEMQVSMLKKALPVPFDIFIAHNTRVLVITGPNTGGKTICLKTVGLAAMMAKSGLYVLASESASIPWFDFVLADIGDEQSLSQSLSTFSGHLKQINEIKSLSTRLSLVLLDEVGAGTNPLEGAAFGMSLLESFADAGALLTIATTHHGELKALKYSNNAFENACMEFDEVNLKPTYRILWGIPGRSNAINVAERLGLPEDILDNARELYGAASSEINELIVDMERSKQDYHHKIQEAQHYLGLSKELHLSLLSTRNRIFEHAMNERYRIMQEMSEAAALARSIIHKKVRESRSLPTQPSKQMKVHVDMHVTSIPVGPHANTEEKATSTVTETSIPIDSSKKAITENKPKFPNVGDMVDVPSLKTKAKVMKLDLSKQEIVVQAGNLKVKLKVADIANR